MFCAKRQVILGFGLLLGMGETKLATAQTSTVRVATGVSRPVFVTAPAGDTNRLFIAEQHTGRIDIMDLSTGSISPTAFLDLTSLATGSEQGLLGLAFDPNYASNGYFYVNVTTSAGSGDTHIRRYQATGDPATSNTASIDSEFEILSFNQPQGNHNGGWIGFGPNDGYLYIASGDGGGGDDNDSGHTNGIGNAQDITNNLLGKILRVDVHGDDFVGDTNSNYAIPANNPFVDKTGDDEIWSYGLRNPYRSSFDRATGDLWIGDVGQLTREEIDYQPANSPGGENYGWRLREGTIPTPTGGVGGAKPADNVEPIYDYAHVGGSFGGNVVIGGYVYRGSVAAFQGHYIFSDAGSANIWKLDPDAVDPRASVTRINSLLQADAGSVGGLSSYGEDANGELYLMELGGEIFRVTTASKDIVWNGDDASVGTAGDGSNWTNANNWTRGGTADQAFVTEDHVIFAAGSSQPDVNLNGDRSVSAVTFQSPYTLQGNTLEVLSGNVTVTTGVTATIESNLEAETANHSLRKLGEGTLIVESTAGQTVVKAGTLGGNGTLDHLTVQAGGTVAPGSSVGALYVTNSLTLETDSTLAIEIGGTQLSEYDQLLVGGTASLGGTLAVELVNSFMPSAGDSFGILVADGGAGGMFDTRSFPPLGPNLEWVLNPGGTTLSLLVNSTLPGDFDNDGDVDGDDLSALETNFGTTGGAGRAQGDADGDFDVDGADFIEWQRGFTGSTAASVAVPEPNSLILALSLLSAVAYGAIREHHFNRETEQ